MKENVFCIWRNIVNRVTNRGLSRRIGRGSPTKTESPKASLSFVVITDERIYLFLEPHAVYKKSMQKLFSFCNFQAEDSSSRNQSFSNCISFVHQTLIRIINVSFNLHSRSDQHYRPETLYLTHGRRSGD